MSLVSVIIPARNEQFLRQTTEELLSKATGEIEIIICLDGYYPPDTLSDERVKYLHKEKSDGMRNAINSCVEVAKGDFIMKIDGHCMVSKGYDEALANCCEKDWVIIPTRKRLDAENWCIQETKKLDIEAMYLGYPDDEDGWGGAGMNGKVWNDKIIKNKDIRLDDEIGFQGSCWFMHRDYFYFLELMDNENYGTFGKEPQEIGLKCWLSGGMVKRNKDVFYAHLHKGKRYGRGYPLDKRDFDKATKYCNKFCSNQGWHKQTRTFKSLIDHFSPMPEWEKAEWNEDGSLVLPPNINI